MLWFLKSAVVCTCLGWSNFVLLGDPQCTDLLGTTACYLQLLILVLSPHAQLFILLSSFMSLCEHTRAGDSTLFQPNRTIFLWFLLQPKEKDVIQTQSTVWL